MLRRTFLSVALVTCVLWCSVADAVERFKFLVAVDQQSKTFRVYGRIWDYSVDPIWQPQDFGDIVQGLAEYFVDLKTTPGLTLSNIQITAPSNYPAQPWGFVMNYVDQRSSNSWRAGSGQLTFWPDIAVIPYVGLFWEPLITGSYSGSGTLTVAQVPTFNQNTGLWYTTVAVIYDDPVTGWDDAEKVDGIQWGEVLDTSVVIP